MTDIITTLHPENDENTNLYPNIKKQNIPDGSVDYIKLADDIKSLLNSVNELHPSGVETSDVILAFTENKGIYIGSDTGYWYYWNGTQYVSGGDYQATAVADGSVDYYKLDENLRNVFDVSPNLLNLNDTDFKDNYRFSSSSASTPSLSASAYFTTGFIRCNENDIIRAKYINNATRHLFAIYYDESKAYLSGVELSNNYTTTLEITAPSNAKYVRLSLTKASDENWQSICMVTINNPIPSSFIVYGLVKVKNLETLINNVNSLLAKTNIIDNTKFFMPSNLYQISQLNPNRRIYKGNMIISHCLNEMYLSGIPYSIYSENVGDYYRIPNNVNIATYVDVRRNTTTESLYNKVFNIHSASQSNVANPVSDKNVLIIGDSFTGDSVLPCMTKKYLQDNLGLTNVKLVGRKTYTYDNITSKGEGTGGYTIKDYIKTNNADGKGASFPNPFLYNGVVDFNTYMSNHASGGNLDIAIIELGVNDMISYGYNVENTITDLTSLINIIKTQYPSCEIFVVGMRYISELQTNTNTYKFNNYMMDLNLAYQTLCESNNYHYLDIGALFENTIFSRQETIDGVLYLTDWLHPNDNGYKHIAEIISSGIAAELFSIL